MMNSIIASVICVSVIQCQKITHELPRLNPYHSLHPASYHGYTSPLRPGYQWPSPHYKYAPVTHHHHQLHHPYHYQTQHNSLPHVVNTNTTFSLEEDQVLENLKRPARGETNKEQTFNFGYAVKDVKHGDDFSHQVSNDGLHTNGEYRVALPDGRVQIVRYTAGDEGFKADVSYQEQHNGKQGSISVSRTAAPVVLVKSPQSSTVDSLFISELPQTPNIDAKRNINIHNDHASAKLPSLAHNGAPDHNYNKYPFFRHPNNFQAIESSHYFIPKSSPKQHLDTSFYTTNFLHKNPDLKGLSQHKPVRFHAQTPVVVGSGSEAPKLAKIQQTPSTTTSTTAAPATTTTSSTPETTTSLPPLLPAFHPDYRPTPVTLQDITETELREQQTRDNVPRYKHSAKYSESLKPYKNVYNQLLPAFHPDFNKKKYSLPRFKISNSIINYVTPLSSTEVSTENSFQNLNPSVSITKMLVSSLENSQEEINDALDDDFKAMDLSEDRQFKEEEKEVIESSEGELMSSIENGISIEQQDEGSGDEESATYIPNISQIMP